MSHHSTPLSVADSLNSQQIPARDDFEPGEYEYNHPPEASIINMAMATDNLLICTACGTQFDTEHIKLLTRCRICDDPRQFVPPAGQSFTTLSSLKRSSKAYKNIWTPFPSDDHFISIHTEPKFAIGQRCILIKTPQGNILWDCITFLDSETISKINDLGGLAAIVISHPHYYTTHLEWGNVFECPVYLSWEDKGWLNRLDRLGKARTFIEGTSEEIEIAGEKTGVTILKLGGHFPGSLVCLAYERLLIADTLLTTPSGLGDWSKGPDGRRDGKPDGMNSYVFMWSIPNMIPLAPDDIARMWEILKKYDFKSTHGAFTGTEVEDGGGGDESSVKKRILGSMQIQVQAMGWKSHSFLKEEHEDEL